MKCTPLGCLESTNGGRAEGHTRTLSVHCRRRVSGDCGPIVTVLSFTLNVSLRQRFHFSSSVYSLRKRPADSVWMEDACLKNVHICQPQSRNIHGKVKLFAFCSLGTGALLSFCCVLLCSLHNFHFTLQIFGGFLMRNAFELAWSTATVHRYVASLSCF